MTALRALLTLPGRWLAARDRRRVARSWVPPDTALYVPMSWCRRHTERSTR